MMRDISLYIHYPFCLSKCPYCDFNSYAGLSYDEDTLLLAYSKEISYYKDILSNRRLKTVYFGGGSPSLMSGFLLEGILKKINKFCALDDIEISMEVNPSSSNLKKIKELRALGINRLSIGVQSLEDSSLKFLGRIHDKKQALDAVDAANMVFGDRYSIDMIYARPNQTIKDWVAELKEAVRISPFHLSLYQLIIEENTKFFEDGLEGINDSIACKMYSITDDILKDKNIYRYEVSNYSREGLECQHNLNYWRSGEWIGIGAGAQGRISFEEDMINGYLERTSIENIVKPEQWFESLNKFGHGICLREKITKYEFIEELFLMGLRTSEGVNIKYLKDYLRLESIYDILDINKVKHLEVNNYIEVSKDYIRIKPRGFNILNSIIERLLC